MYMFGGHTDDMMKVRCATYMYGGHTDDMTTERCEIGGRDIDGCCHSVIK